MKPCKEQRTRLAAVFLLSGVITVMNISGASYIFVGEHVYLDLSMIPAAIIVMLLPFRYVWIFGLWWGGLNCFTHPDNIYMTYFGIVLSHLVFCFALEGAQYFADRRNLENYNRYYAVFFAVCVHSLLFDFGLAIWAHIQHGAPIPVHQVVVKIGLTIIFFYLSISLVIRQLNQVVGRHRESM